MVTLKVKYFWKLSISITKGLLPAHTLQLPYRICNLTTFALTFDQILNTNNRVC